MSRDSTALAVVQSRNESLDEPAFSGDFSSNQIDLLKRTICVGATDDEFLLFVATARRLRLDPFARQIFAVKRWDSLQGRNVMSIQIAIDGFRLIAERTGRYKGQLGPFWCGRDGVWRDVWLDKDPPMAARVGVLRDGFSEPLWNVARWDSYAQMKKDGQPNNMWRGFPDVMIAKCAEALALRRAFPAELGGVYAVEEMGQASNESSTVETVHVDVQQVDPRVAIEASLAAGLRACESADAVRAYWIDHVKPKAATLGKRAMDRLGKVGRERTSAFTPPAAPAAPPAPPSAPVEDEDYPEPGSNG